MIIVENFPTQKGNSQVQEVQSPKQDKPKEKHTNTHINQTNKDSTQRKNIKTWKREAISYIQGKPYTFNT